MKNFKKFFSLFLVYFFVLALIPANVFNHIAKAGTSVPKFLNYNEGYLSSKNLYKDKALLQIEKPIYDSKTYYFNNGNKTQVNETVNRKYNDSKVILNKFDENDNLLGEIYDLDQGKVTGAYDFNELNSILFNKYGEIHAPVFDFSIAGSKKGPWYTYSFAAEDLSIQGIVTPDKKIVELETLGDIITHTISSDKFYSMVEKFTDGGYSTEYIFRTINTDGNIKDVKLDDDLNHYFIINKIFVSNDKVYVHLENNLNNDYSEKAVNGYYELVEKDGKLSKGDALLEDKDIQLTQDANGSFWYVKAGTVYKYENSQWVKKYEADARMSEIEVYDDNNFVLTNSWIEKYKFNNSDEVLNYLAGIYTLVSNGKCITNDKGNQVVPTEPEEPTTPSTPSTGSGQDNGGTTNNGNTGSNSGNPSNGSETNGQNPSTPTNGSTTTTPEKVVVSPVKDGVLPIAVNKLDKNTANVVEAVSVSNANKLEVTIADTKAIKEGAGSIQVKVGQNSLINLPFSVIDKSLLTDTAKVVLSTSAESNTDLVKGLKAVKKLYSFDISVVDGDKKTSVHKFANGVAEITLALSDEELKGLDKNNLAVFYYNEDTKKFELMETKVEGNKITFKTPHFSKFIIAEKSTNTVEVLPKTGSSFDSMVIVSIGAALVVLGIGTLRFKKSINVNR